jgi:uncharacterized protein (TIGR03382 family)
MRRVTQTVTADGVVATLSASAPTVVFGTPVNFTATITAATPGAGQPTGLVLFRDGTTTIGTATLAGGAASLSVDFLPTGTNNISAVYGGDANFSGGTTATVVETVTAAPTTTTLSGSPSSVQLGQIVTLTASVSSEGSGTPAGNVTFTDTTTSTALATGPVTLDGSGMATLTVAGLGVGAHVLSAVYDGEGNFAGSSGTFTVTVATADTATVLASSSNPSVVGQSVTFTASVTSAVSGSTPTGTVSFIAGAGAAATPIGTGTLDANGTATFSTAALQLGQTVISAQYSGDASFSASASNALNQEVDKDGVALTLTSSANPQTFGTAVKLTATVKTSAPGAAALDGSVTFFDATGALAGTNGTALGAAVKVDATGAATLSVSLDAGKHALIAVYANDSLHNGGASATLVQVVQAAPTATTLALTGKAEVNLGATVTFVASVTSIAAGAIPGTVTFLDHGGTPLATMQLGADGTATFQTGEAFDYGQHSVTARYDGAGNFASSTSDGVALKVDQTVGTGCSSTGSPAMVLPMFLAAALFIARRRRARA